MNMAVDGTKGSHRTKKAVVLLSGGLDSTTVCGIAASENHEIYALSFDYGQTLKRELFYAKKIAAHFRVVDHKIFQIDLAKIGGSALTDDLIEIPLDRKEDDMRDIPLSYVPARNTIFLSIALGWAEVLGADSIYIGVNAVDYSGYPDCRPGYIDAYQKMANLATRRGVEGDPVIIKTPLLHMKKSEIIRLGHELGVPYQYTWSCYSDSEWPCGRCDSCVLRKKGFHEAGLVDPALVE
ncbi:MAG: 7-cyano-7-deazaguanine synthase QueC [Candidatus Thermoplasmatota archaeon]|jgi:7-cyano-7-deazaguanine synthase|nr:7-cyano-7-deazaguanine synthase QueC [Candidatus Thermoplasmatota archaeon]